MTGAPGAPSLVERLVAMRRAIYGAELGWITEGSDVAWDRYDLHSTALVTLNPEGALVGSGRLSVERDGPLEVSDLVAWKSGLPEGLRGALAAEWSRVMILEAHRGHGLFRTMFLRAREAAREAGVVILAGASVDGLRPLYEGLGFTYLDLPFRSNFFDASPIYWPKARD